MWQAKSDAAGEGKSRSGSIPLFQSKVPQETVLMSKNFKNLQMEYPLPNLFNYTSLQDE